MTGSIKDYTPNFNLIIPEFNITGWHDYLEENFRSIDALFYNLFGINNYKGIWTNNTVYNVGDVLFIGEDTSYSGRLIKVLVQHTTAGTGNFTEFFTANPSYYELFADASTAQLFAQEAKDWAVKMDGPVKDDLFSAKFYANIVNGLSIEITSLYNIRSDIQNVSLIGTEVVTVSNIKNSVQTVANNSTNINTVANNTSNINTVASNSANINSVARNSTNINSVANNITNIVNVANNNTNINTVATNIVNVNTNATNINAINTNASNISAIQSAYSNAQSALNSKNKAQEWATSENLVDNTDYSAKHYANQSQTSAELSAQYANDKINQTHITNCIKEIPQDIKLELNNGTLTLKAGSKVYVPNGAAVFDEITIASDLTHISTGSASNTQVLIYNGSSIFPYLSTEAYSGTTQPTPGTQFAVWYDTANNKIKTTADTGSTWQETSSSLPVAIISKKNGVWTSIDQVFNGFGYIGSTVFALPGVKGLIPNGRNADGSLKNIEFTNSSVRTYTFTNPFNNWPVIFGPDRLYALSQFRVEDTPSRIPTSGQWFSYYSPKDNKIYQSDNGGDWVTSPGYIIGNETISSGKITSFIPKTVFHAVDYNDVVLKQDFQIVSTLPANPDTNTFYFIPE